MPSRPGRVLESVSTTAGQDHIVIFGAAVIFARYFDHLENLMPTYKCTPKAPLALASSTHLESSQNTENHPTHIARTLIISNNALSVTSNNGKTLNALFSTLNCANVAQIYFNKETPSSRVTEKYYRVTDIEQAKSALQKNRFSAGSAIPPSHHSRPTKTKSPKIKRKILSAINKYAETVKLLSREVSFSSIKRNKKILSWINEFNPQHIFLVAGNNLFTIDFAIHLSKKLSIPITTYITDDYVITGTPTGPFSHKYSEKLVKKYAEILSISRSVFFIGDLMKEHFAKKFGVTGETLINCSLIEDPSKFSPPTPDHHKRIRAIYAGGLHLGRDKSIIAFAKLLKDTCQKLEIEPTFDLYSHQAISEYTKSEFNSCGVNFKGGLPWDELKRELKKSDFLLHVESFEKRNQRKTMLSVSTKIPEYLSSGKCVVAYGPESVASIKILAENNIGITITGANRENAEKLASIIKSYKLRRNYAMRGDLFAKKNFAPEIMSARLQKALEKV